jgi:hypothetical protein
VAMTNAERQRRFKAWLRERMEKAELELAELKAKTVTNETVTNETIVIQRAIIAEQQKEIVSLKTQITKQGTKIKHLADTIFEERARAKRLADELAELQLGKGGKGPDAVEHKHLAKLLGMLGSAHDGEVLAAARKAEAARKKMGKQWNQLIR